MLVLRAGVDFRKYFDAVTLELSATVAGRHTPQYVVVEVAYAVSQTWYHSYVRLGQSRTVMGTNGELVLETYGET